MTEQPEQEQPTKELSLNPLYEPAEFDSTITAHFVGNSAVISHYDAFGISPYHMLAAAEDMKRKAFQMLQAAEIAEVKAQQERAKLGIQTPGAPGAVKLPPGGFQVKG